MKTVFFFTRKSCSVCQAMYPTWNGVVPSITSFDYEVIDCDTNFEFAKSNLVMTLPTFIILGDDGKELGRREGFMKKETFESWLRSV